MKPVLIDQNTVKGTPITYAEDQPEYFPLPVIVPFENPNVVVSKWELNG